MRGNDGGNGSGWIGTGQVGAVWVMLRLGEAKVGWSFVVWLSMLNFVKKEFWERHSITFVNKGIRSCELLIGSIWKYRTVSKKTNIFGLQSSTYSIEGCPGHVGAASGGGAGVASARDY